MKAFSEPSAQAFLPDLLFPRPTTPSMIRLFCPRGNAFAGFILYRPVRLGASRLAPRVRNRLRRNIWVCATLLYGVGQAARSGSRSPDMAVLQSMYEKACFSIRRPVIRASLVP